MTAEIDSMIEKVANQSSLVKINTSIQNNFHFLQEGRKFIHSAPVIISGDKSGPGPGSFIIFNDIIVLVKRLSKTSKVFYDSPVLEFVYKRNSAAQHSISISFPKKSYLMKKKGGYVFTVDFHSENEEKTWFSKLREVQISRSLQQKDITAKNMIWEPFVTNKNIPEMADNKAIVFGNSVYIFNGTETSSELITISLEDNKVSQTQMPIKKASFKAFCLSIIGDKIYGPCTRGIFQYQPTMNTYKVAVLKGKGFEPLKGQTSVSIKNNLFIFGGENEQGIPQNTFYRFNPVEKTVASITEHLPEPRTNHTTVEHGGHMYIFGGRTNKGVTNQLLMYSPRRNKWMNIDINGLIPRENHVSIVANDIMVIIGGSEKAQAQFVDLKKKCLISVNELGNVPEIISRFAAILANNDKIVCIGGESNGALTNMIYEIKLPFELSQEIVHKRYDSYNEISATKEIPKLEFTPKLKRSKSPVNHVTKRNKKTMEEVSPLFDNSDPFNKTEEFPSIQSQIPVSLFESYTLTLPEEADLDDEAAEIAAKEAEEKRRLEEEERLRKEEEERKRKEKEEKRRLKEEKRKRDEMTNELNERLNLDANKVHDNDKDDLADVAEKAFNDVIKSREIPQEENEIPKIAEKVYLEGLTNASEKEVSKPLRDSIVDLRIKEEKEKLKDIIDNSPVEESPDLLANLFEQFENERKPICQLAEVIVNRNIQEKMENSPEDDKQKVTDLISKVLTDISKDDNLKFKDLDESKLDDIISQQMEDVDIEENEDLFHDLAKEAVGDVLSAVQLKGLEPALNQFANNAIDDVLNDQAVLESENKENAVKESIINNDDVPEKLAFEILDMMIPDVTYHYNETLDALPTIAIGLVSNLALVEQPNSLEKSKIALEKARDLCLANSNENEKVLKLTDEALSKLQNPDDLSSQDLINDFIANINKDAPTNVVASILNSAIDNCLSAVNSNKDKSVESIVKDSISAVDNKELENVISDLKSQSSIPINAAAVASVSLVAKTSLQAVSQHPDDPKLVEQAKESIKAAADLALVVIADDDELSKDVILMTTKFADRALDEHRNVSSEDELKTKLKDVIANQLKSDLLEAEKDKANSKDLIDLLDIAAMAKIASENESDPENKKDLDNLLNKCREEAIAKLDEINHHQIPIEEIEKIVDAMLNEMASKLESNPDMRQSSINYINEQLQKAKEAYEESPKDQDRDQFIYDYIMDNKPSVDDEDYDVISRDIDFGEFGEEITDEQIKDKLGDKADGLSKDEAMKALEDQMIGDIGSKLAESLVDRLLNDYHENELISQMVREAINAMVKDILAKMKDEDAEKIIQQVSASAMAQLALKH
ncbi:nitrile biosynthetic process, partial [Trichomonas vaginalis G3]